ncbi:MAG: prepilin-type N-terminal cleavage/methylation domain-containing protein [Deltaproteobacteria bacterium]|nr:prepilin-type N-terminal cleavage/methylation domain-containing protein [Deltaproteobacteria bacterium]
MMKKQAGFTLVEVLVAIVVGMIIIGVIYAGVIASQRFTVGVDRKVVAYQDARAVLDLMALEIQMASFNPNYTTDLWRDPSNCTSQSGNQTYKGIQAATGSVLSIEADIDEKNGVLKVSPATDPPTNPNEIITYKFDADKQYITRNTGCGGDQAFLGDAPASGNPRGVRVINTAAVPVFRYFNAQGGEITTAAGIPDIARIDITLWVETEDVDPSTGQRRKMVYSTSVIPRNHVINVNPGS